MIRVLFNLAGLLILIVEIEVLVRLDIGFLLHLELLVGGKFGSASDAILFFFRFILDGFELDFRGFLNFEVIELFCHPFFFALRFVDEE